MGDEQDSAAGWGQWGHERPRRPVFEGWPREDGACGLPASIAVRRRSLAHPANGSMGLGL